jgi:peptide/nickel transport system substrate-binding protein
VSIQVAADAQTMVTQMEAGALDTASQPLLIDVARLAKNPQYQVIESKGSAYFALAFNGTIAPTSDKRVRQALNYALDRKRFASTVMEGFSVPEALPWPDYSPAYEASKANAYGFDLDKAKSLLNEAGVSNLNLEFTYAKQVEFDRLGEIYKSDLAKIGVNLTLKGLELASALVELDKFTFHVGGLVTRYAETDPSSLFLLANFWNVRRNRSGLSDEKLVGLVDQAAIEPDVAKRKALYSQINDSILDTSGLTTVASSPQFNLARANVKDSRIDVNGNRLHTFTWLA